MIDIWTDLDWSIPYPYTEQNNSLNFSASIPVLSAKYLQHIISKLMRVPKLICCVSWQQGQHFTKMFWYSQTLTIALSVRFLMILSWVLFPKILSIYFTIKCWHVICNPQICTSYFHYFWQKKDFMELTETSNWLHIFMTQ